MSADGSMIINGTDFNPNTHISYAKPRLNKSGGKSVAVNQAGTTRWLHISSPLMLTWGVNEYVDDSSGRRSYDLSLQFPKEGYETTATTRFLAAISSFQSELKAAAVRNSKEWLGKSKMSAEVVDALFHPMLRHPKDQETGEPDMTRAPTLRVKLDFWDEAFNCEVYDIQRGQSGAHKRLFPDEAGGADGPGPMDLISKGTNIACILKCGGLWFANGKFGCTWKLVQAIVKPRASIRGRCMIELSDLDQAALDGQGEGEGTAVAVAGASVVVEDSEEEEEEDDAGVPTFSPSAPPVPAPMTEPKKRRVVRRKPVAQQGSG
jgi:hypothetical protein